jgi:hypothetical protein
VEANVAGRLDLLVAGARALGEACPDRVAVERAVDAALVVVTAKDVVMFGTDGRLVGANQRDAASLS